MRPFYVVVLAYCVLASFVFVVRVGRPRDHRDPTMAWFLLAMGWSSVLVNLTLALGIAHLLSGGWVSAVIGSTVITAEACVLTWRLVLSWRIADVRSRKTDTKVKRDKVGGMRFKIDPEVIRLVVMITAGIQAMTAVLTGTDALPDRAFVWVVAVGAFLQGIAAAYAQGVQTEPAHGMLTEEYSKQTDPAVMQTIATSAGREPAPGWVPDTRDPLDG